MFKKNQYVYLLKKYMKRGVWMVAVGPSYIWEAQFLKVNFIWNYSGTSVHERPCSRTNFPSKKRLGWRTVSRITNTQADNSGKLRVSARECQFLVNFGSVNIPACIRRAFSWISLCFVLFFNICTVLYY
jgi:hypothetical protein